MKTNFFIILFASVVLGLISQNASAQNLESYFEKEYLENLKLTDPNELVFLQNSLERGMYISEIPQVKAKEISFDGEISLDLTQLHNVFSIGKEVQENYQYYTITGTKKMVVIHPRAFIYPTKH